ncbi:hypothetical protein L6164_017083 [Bauhinia variegata]|uniref:Uncharacterized protein n=1 Tax=Bauhinia variegata TaxID=167791 RepID=A0ACB9N6X7_BAUVA|nr:hypothetical protein L6164_017083 [Bauhinia variegata]
MGQRENDKTITERIRYMLSHAKLLKAFWGEAMRTAVDIINLSPSVPLSGDIPERVWKGKYVLYKHLRLFCCRAFVHIPRDERFKLDGKSKQCIFLGYDHTIKDIEKEDKPKPIARNDNVYEPKLPARDVNDGGDANTNVLPINTELTRSVRQSRPSQKYPSHEYVLLTNEGELESDSQSAIHLSKNLTFHSRSKHIEVRYHWIRDALERKQFSLEKIHTDDNGSDMMTKTLPMGKFATCRMKASMVEYGPISS